MVRFSKGDKFFYRIFQVGSYTRSLYGAEEKKGTVIKVLNLISLQILERLTNEEHLWSHLKEASSPYDATAKRELFAAFENIMATLGPQEQEIASHLTEGGEDEIIMAELGCSQTNVQSVRQKLQEGLAAFVRVDPTLATPGVAEGEKSAFARDEQAVKAARNAMVVVLSGPSGAGKSTFFATFRKKHSARMFTPPLIQPSAASEK